MAPYRLDDFRAKIQFIAPAAFPSLINRACNEAGVTSQTRYIQLAVCRALSEDLGIDEGILINSLPPTRGMSAALFGGDRKAIRRRAPRVGL